MSNELKQARLTGAPDRLSSMPPDVIALINQKLFEARVQDRIDRHQPEPLFEHVFLSDIGAPPPNAPPPLRRQHAFKGYEFTRPVSMARQRHAIETSYPVSTAEMGSILYRGTPSLHYGPGY